MSSSCSLLRQESSLHCETPMTYFFPPRRQDVVSKHAHSAKTYIKMVRVCVFITLAVGRLDEHVVSFHQRDFSSTAQIDLKLRQKHVRSRGERGKYAKNGKKSSLIACRFSKIPYICTAIPPKSASKVCFGRLSRLEDGVTRNKGRKFG